jgi:hypothetical protein
VPRLSSAAYILLANSSRDKPFTGSTRGSSNFRKTVSDFNFSVKEADDEDAMRLTRPVNTYVHTPEDQLRMYVSLSPAGLFARTNPLDIPKMGGSSQACQRFKRIMEDRAAATAVASHMINPHLGGGDNGSKRALNKDGSPPPSQESAPRRRGAVMEVVEDEGRSQIAAGWKELQRRKAMFDIWQGLRLKILGEHPVPIGADRPWPPIKATVPKSQEEPLRVYKVFCELQLWDATGGPPVSEPDDGVPVQSRSQQNRASTSTATESEDGSSTEGDLTPISWPSFMTWLEHCEDFAGDVRSKQAYGALRVAVETMWKSGTQPSVGVDLEMMFRWIWPYTAALDLADIFAHLCRHEMQRVRISTPRPVPDVVREQHTRAFHIMDRTDRGYITPDDLADNENVDAFTVKDVIGTDEIYLSKFLELVCEDSYRGHEAARVAILEDGRYARRHDCEAVDMNIWTLRFPPKSDERIWRRVNALEAKVIAWKEASYTEGPREL